MEQNLYNRLSWNRRKSRSSTRTVDEFPDIFSIRDGNILCANGETISVSRREAELLQVLHETFGHFRAWQDVARRMFSIESEAENEGGMIRTYASRLKYRIDGKCSFGIEGKSGYGYRLFGKLLIDE